VCGWGGQGCPVLDKPRGAAASWLSRCNCAWAAAASSVRSARSSACFCPFALAGYKSVGFRFLFSVPVCPPLVPARGSRCVVAELLPIAYHHAGGGPARGSRESRCHCTWSATSSARSTRGAAPASARSPWLLVLGLRNCANYAALHSTSPPRTGTMPKTDIDFFVDFSGKSFRHGLFAKISSWCF
jgi:hypothetical protein